MVLSTAMVAHQDSWLRKADHPQEEQRAAFKQEHRDLSQTYKSVYTITVQYIFNVHLGWFPPNSWLQAVYQEETNLILKRGS